MPVWATLLIAMAATSADVPRRFNYQARLVGPAYGDAVVDLQVKFWDGPVGGTELFSELHYEVSLRNGIFSIPVGAAAGFIPDTALDAPPGAGNGGLILMDTRAAGSAQRRHDR